MILLQATRILPPARVHSGKPLIIAQKASNQIPVLGNV